MNQHIPPDFRVPGFLAAGMASGINAALWRLPNGASLTVGAYLIGIGMLALPFYIATVLYVSAITMFWFLFKDAKLLEETHEEPRRIEPAVQEATVRIP